MAVFQKHFRLLVISSMLAGAPLSGAYAQAAEGALDRLKALMTDQGMTMEWDAADIAGDDAVLTGVRVGVHDAQGEIGTVTLTGISQVGSGYRVETFVMDDYRMGDATSGVRIDEMVITGMLLPGEDEQDDYGGFLFYETVETPSGTVNVEGTDVLTLRNLRADISAPVGGSPMAFTGTVEEFTVDLSFADADQRAILRALGYDRLQGHIEIAGSWQPSDGRLALSQYDLTVADAGTLGLSFDLGGYTSAFVASLRELQQQVLANPDADNSAQGLAILGLAQQLSFNGAEIAFTDDSLTRKVLEFVAAQQGMSPSNIANQAKAVLPFALAQLGNPELTMQATQAVSSFLDNPQSLRITAAPPSPVPFALIAAGAMSAPQDLTRTLGVTISAND